MNLLWEVFQRAVPLITHGDPYLWSVIWFTIQVAAIATTAAAVIGLPLGLTIGLGRFRGRSTLQILANASLALREARIGIVAALLAALGTGLAEVGAIVIVGGNVYGYDQTLASAALYDANAAHYDEAVAVSLVLIGLILIVMSAASLLQHQGGGIRMRFRAASG
jgi:tungstate transport system permease protein